MTDLGQVSAPANPRLRRSVLVTVAMGSTVAGLSAGAAGELPSATALIAAVGVVALARTLNLPVRVGSEHIMLGWGEAALVVVLGMLAPAWVAPSVLCGVLIGQLVIQAGLVRAFYTAAAHTVAAGAAAAVVVAGGVVPLVPLTARGVAVLCLAVATYTGLAALFAFWAVSVASGSRLSAVVVRSAGITALMMVGNTAAGLLVLALGVTDVRWLVAVPPVLWLLSEAYQARLRVGEERRAWQGLADATRQLNLLDQRDVLTAAARSACRLFSADAVEIVAERPPCTVVGTAGGEVVQREGADLISTGADSAGHRGDTVRRVLAVAGTTVGELRLRFYRPVSLRDREHLALSAFADALGAALENAATHAALRELVERTSHHAAHDTLTGLANRVRLLEYGETALRALADSGRASHVALLLLDLNHFRDVNDALGHAAGDRVLQATAERLAATIGPDELLARLGGDEFGVLLTSLPETASPLEHATARGRALVDALSAPVEVAGVALVLEASVGVVTVPAGTCDATELLRRADVAMYQAKRCGRVVAPYDGSRDSASTDRLALIAELRDALETEDQLVLELQPAVDLVSGEPVGAEALVRWRHPRRGLLAPAEFVGVVEQSELVGPFTRYVLDRALAVAASWAADGLKVPVAVNLSARSLSDRQLPTEIADLLGKHKVAPERLVLEITETVMMTELDVIEDVLSALRTLGTQLAVDDFGTGYSSLTFLARFPVHEVKVDRAFVTRMLESPEARAIVRSTVELGRSLDLRVVAEGVETAEQRAALAEMGCHAAQGYHFFAPMPAEKAGHVLWTLVRSARDRGAQVIRLARGAQAHRAGD